jgi:hypothetical protein
MGAGLAMDSDRRHTHRWLDRAELTACVIGYGVPAAF